MSPHSSKYFKVKYSLKVKTSKELFSISIYRVDTQISSGRKTSGRQRCLAPDLH